MIRLVLALAGLLHSAAPAAATVTYSYQGKPFDAFLDDQSVPGSYDSTMFVSGFFELAEALDANLDAEDIATSVLSFSFSDGRQTITNLTATTSTFRVSTDGLGNILSWRALVGEGNPQTALIQTANETLGGRLVELDQARIGAVLQAFDQGSVSGQPGAWTLIPEPSTVLLFAAGLVGLGLKRRMA